VSLTNNSFAICYIHSNENLVIAYPDVAGFAYTYTYTYTYADIAA
jgi:hypothetical protein